jgi:hypothetical protein
LKTEMDLAHWQLSSGNLCSATLTLDEATDVRLGFTWKQPPTPDDFEEFDVSVQPNAMDLALKCVLGRAEIAEARRQLFAEGKIVRLGTRNGRWVWARSGSDTNVDGTDR